jgi:hypothetical protein
MKSVIERMKKESARTFEFGWKNGARLGTAWAMKHSRCSDLRRIGEGSQTFDKDDDDVVRFLRTYYMNEGYYEDERAIEEHIQLERECDADIFRRGRNAGFVDAVKHVWEEVRSSFTDSL